MGESYVNEKPNHGLINQSFDNEDDVGLEVSHGSSINLQSFFFTKRNSWFNFFLNLLVATVFLLIIAALAFFCTDKIPYISSYIKEKRPIYKTLIVIGVAILLFILGIFFFLRNQKPLKYFWCFFCCFFTRSLKYFPEDNKSCVVSTVSRDDAKWKNGNIKLFELSESEIYSLKQLMTDFKEKASSREWTFSTKQSSSSAQGFKNSYPAISFSAKIFFLGFMNAGKTSIFHRILYDRFSQHYISTIGADLGHVTLHINPSHSDNHVEIHLQLWDISGAEKLSNLSHIIYKDTTAFIVVIDVTKPNGLSESMPLLHDICSFINEPYVALFFNKVDIKSADKHFLSNDNFMFDQFSLSAKSGENVLESVVDVVVCAVLQEINKIMTDK